MGIKTKTGDTTDHPRILAYTI